MLTNKSKNLKIIMLQMVKIKKILEVEDILILIQKILRDKLLKKFIKMFVKN